MTNERVGSFVSDLVEMAKAVERVPELESEIRGFQFEVRKLLEESAQRQSDLDQARTYAASLEQRCHDLEVSRDAAELRFLESDDAKGTIERSMRALRGEIDSVLQAIAPIEPEPKADKWAELMANPLFEPSDFPLVDGPLAPQGEVSEVPVDPTSADTEGQSSIAASTTETIAAPSTSIEEAPADATSDPQPSTASPSPMPTSPNAPPVETLASAASDSDPGPYFDKLYINFPDWISRQDWLAGGGSEANYDYRLGY